jgi:hypothetical protein
VPLRQTWIRQKKHNHLLFDGGLLPFVSFPHSLSV